ncbi:alkylation response protein AidB-like acyl-CoA dehydrogenase [Evansella vedderi]|uniref:Alkylation response protein AidB-like acyl-CoA dehydrogenase n=1 Tax=Evansella vedderi TaxID=38282 RepID=A0ABT9ZRX6_9BACI|nr:acyl-CoA dehydrogenase family protein [Evansella vedderi]MDQ0253981.1 alkylation response protein AidB-like acyl-CoA dehydrogenase [Evansella vedderi]
MDPNTLSFIKTEKQERLWNKANDLVKSFQGRAAVYDQDALFPIENFHDLKNNGLTALTVPQKYGGEEINLYEFLLIQETIAKGDAATALSLGWHNGTIMQLRDTKKWEEAVFQKVANSVVDEHKIINTAATEPSTGSPARGGKPETTAVKNKDGWLINGKKTFTSLAPVLDWIIITATAHDGETEFFGEFLLQRETPGIHFEETWDTLGMRATRSDDLILTNLQVPSSALVATKDPGHGRTPQGWLLHIPACYLGIALAARNDAIEFAKSYQPNTLPHPISEVPEVRRKIATMDLGLMKARHFMYHVASIWDEYPEKRNTLGAELAAVKTVGTNTAIEVVDLAMRIVGGQSLHRSKAFERYYRDVRAGLHNPPSDDLTMMALGKKAVEEYQ